MQNPLFRLVAIIWRDYLARFCFWGKQFVIVAYYSLARLSLWKRNSLASEAEVFRSRPI